MSFHLAKKLLLQDLASSPHSQSPFALSRSFPQPPTFGTSKQQACVGVDANGRSQRRWTVMPMTAMPMTPLMGAVIVVRLTVHYLNTHHLIYLIILFDVYIILNF